MTLVEVVSKIVREKVTEDQAKDFALDNYGILATYIRQQFVESIIYKKDERKFEEIN